MLVDVFDIRTGRAVQVPARWMDHPHLSAGYSRTWPVVVPSPPTPPPVVVEATEKPGRRKRPAPREPATAPAVVVHDSLAPAAGDTEQESDPRC